MYQTILGKQTGPVWQWPERPVPEIRIYSNLSYNTPEGEFVPAGIPDQGKAFRRSDCQLANKVLTVPTIITPATTDGVDRADARFTAGIWQGNNYRMPWLNNYVQPHTMGAIGTWDRLTIFNAAYIPFRDVMTLTRQQILDLIADYFQQNSVIGQGRAGLVNGEVTVYTALVADETSIHLGAQDEGVSGDLRVSARVPGESFTIKSNNIFDAGVVSWQMLEILAVLVPGLPAPPAIQAFGRATMAAGEVVVAAPQVTNLSNIFKTAQDDGVSGSLRISARVNGVGFTVASSNPLDAGVIAWELLES